MFLCRLKPKPLWENQFNLRLCMTAASGNVKCETAPEASCKGTCLSSLTVCVCVCARMGKKWIKSECVYKVVFLHNVNETKQKPYFLSLNSLSQSLRVPNLHVLQTSLFLNKWSCMGFSLHATHAVYSSYINMIKETTQTKKNESPK